MMWLFSIGGPYRFIRKLFIPEDAPLLRWLFVLWRLKVFMLTMLFALAVALGLTVNDIYYFFALPVK